MHSSASRILLLASLVLTGCAHQIQLPRQAPVAPLACLPEFPFEEGWLGGDAAYSVPLSRTETLWLFGDTFVGVPGQADREGSTFIHNSVGVSHCQEDIWNIEYFWGTDAAGAPRAFLHEPRVDGNERWWWLFDGFVHRERLYIGLLEVERAAPQGLLQLPFRPVGIHLGRVENPEASPATWRTSTLPLWEDAAALPGAMVVHGDWLYLFNFLQKPDGSSPRALARLPLSALEAAAPSLPDTLEYLSLDGHWKPGLDPADSRVLMTDNATEMSVVWHPDLQRWLATYSHPNAQGQLAVSGPSQRVFVRTAVSLEGPWSEALALFDVPELQQGFDPAKACYAAKEHRQFSWPGEITFTYVCNLMTPPGGDPGATLMRLFHDMSLYRPRAVTRNLPEELQEAAR
jgi:hypothetical protein